MLVRKAVCCPLNGVLAAPGHFDKFCVYFHLVQNMLEFLQRLLQPTFYLKLWF